MVVDLVDPLDLAHPQEAFPLTESRSFPYPEPYPSVLNKNRPSLYLKKLLLKLLKKRLPKESFIVTNKSNIVTLKVPDSVQEPITIID